MSDAKRFFTHFKENLNSQQSTSQRLQESVSSYEGDMAETKRKLLRSRSGRIKQFVRSRSKIDKYTFQPMKEEDAEKNTREEKHLVEDSEIEIKNWIKISWAVVDNEIAGTSGIK